MGTWGSGAFENDSASDWIYDLEKAKDWSLVRTTLSEAIAAAGLLTVSDGEVAVGAAETVAAAMGQPVDELPEEVERWVAGHQSNFPPDLIGLAVKAVDGVLAGSELKEAWDESPDVAEWKSAIAKLRLRLTAP